MEKYAKKIEALLKCVKAKKHPKKELRGISVDKNKLIATDSRHMIVIEFNENFTDEEGVMLVERISDINLDLSYPQNYEQIMTANGGVLGFMGLIPVMLKYGKFVDYARTIQSDYSDFTEKETGNYLDCIAGEMVLLSGSFVNIRQIEKPIKIICDICEFGLRLSQHRQETPIFLRGNLSDGGKITYITMPVTR